MERRSAKYALVVHGGAGSWEPELLDGALAGLQAALLAGTRILQAGGAALDAALAAATVLEDDPRFNAGTGGTLTLEGEVEVDAAVMDGVTLRAGGVASVRNVKNPAALARRVMEETDHVLLAGPGAEAIARAWGFANGNAPTEARLAAWRTARAKLLDAGDRDPSAGKIAKLVAAHPELAATRRGTIGAAACDVRGACAAVTSTGGVLLKLPGRIGDSPLPGAGNYATSVGAASATGRGELMMRALTTRTCCDLIAQGLSPQEAAQEAVARTAQSTGEDDLGLIAVGADGRVGIAHATADMPHGFILEGSAAVTRVRGA